MENYVVEWMRESSPQFDPYNGELLVKLNVIRRRKKPPGPIVWISFVYFASHSRFVLRCSFLIFHHALCLFVGYAIRVSNRKGRRFWMKRKWARGTNTYMKAAYDEWWSIKPELICQLINLTTFYGLYIVACTHALWRVTLSITIQNKIFTFELRI